MDKVLIGRIVHYVLANGDHRPAIVVAVWPEEFSSNPEDHTGLNLQVFLDGFNDKQISDGIPVTSMGGNSAPIAKWITRAPYCSITSHGETWHWPERE